MATMRWVANWVLAAVVLAACHTVPEQVRQGTAPPDFVYITRQQLHETMWKLAKEVHELNALMRAPGTIDDRRRDEIVAHLNAMEDAARQVKGQPGWHSNHPVIDDKLALFLADVERARRAALDDPPSYYLAASVSGACLYCHGVPAPDSSVQGGRASQFPSSS